MVTIIHEKTIKNTTDLVNLDPMFLHIFLVIYFSTFTIFHHKHSIRAVFPYDFRYFEKWELRQHACQFLTITSFINEVQLHRKIFPGFLPKPNIVKIWESPVDSLYQELRKMNETEKIFHWFIVSSFSTCHLPRNLSPSLHKFDSQFHLYILVHFVFKPNNNIL